MKVRVQCQSVHQLDLVRGGLSIDLRPDHVIKTTILIGSRPRPARPPCAGQLSSVPASGWSWALPSLPGRASHPAPCLLTRPSGNERSLLGWIKF